MIATPAPLRPHRKPLRPGRYLAQFLAPLLLAGTIGLGLYVFLLRAQETTGPITAAHRQELTGELYGAALVYRPIVYKLERYRMKRPDILVLGSSRVMPFAGEAFKDSVLNAGGAANSLEQLVDFIRDAVAIHPPRSILIGVDFWWFNPHRVKKIRLADQDSDSVDLTLQRLTMPLRWLGSGQISAGDFLATLWPWHESRPGIGALAKFGHQGWDNHGRFDYGGLYDGTLDNPDKQFKRTLEWLANAQPPDMFYLPVVPSTEGIDRFKALVSELKARNIEVVVTLPPLATPVLARIAADPDARLLPMLRGIFRSLEVRVFDFTDPTRLNSPDCEFLDGFHGGEVTYLRMLDAIAAAGDSILADAIDRNIVAKLIAANAGRARLPELQPAGTPPEIDFLDLGCNRQP